MNRLIVSCLVILLLFPGGVMGQVMIQQDATSNVTITVVDESGNDVSGLIVSVDGPGIMTDRSTRSDGTIGLALESGESYRIRWGHKSSSYVGLTKERFVVPDFSSSGLTLTARDQVFRNIQVGTETDQEFIFAVEVEPDFYRDVSIDINSDIDGEGGDFGEFGMSEEIILRTSRTIDTGQYDITLTAENYKGIWYQKTVQVFISQEDLDTNSGLVYSEDPESIEGGGGGGDTGTGSGGTGESSGTDGGQDNTSSGTSDFPWPPQSLDDLQQLPEIYLAGLVAVGLIVFSGITTTIRREDDDEYY